MTQLVTKTNNAIASTMDSNDTAKMFTTLVLSNDLSKLSEPQLVEYYKMVCERLQLDAMRKPFEVMILNGKKQLYPTKECTAQLTASRKLTVSLVSREEMDGLCIVTARCAYPDGTGAEDIGATSVEGLKGEAKANAIMKATTKAKRRAVLAACGLGMIDESERESVQGIVEEVPLQITATLSSEDDEAVEMWQSAFEGCDDAEMFTLAFKEQRKANEAVRNALKPFVASTMERLRCKWSKEADAFVSIA